MSLEAWRSALAETKRALLKLDGADLVEAKAELAAALAGVSERVQRQGGDPLLESVLTDGICAAQGECSADDVRKIFAGLKVTRCNIEVDEADPGNGQIAASVCGLWSAWGQSFGFRAAVTETCGAMSGEVHVSGVGFSANGPLDCGCFDAAVRDEVIEEWLRQSGAKVNSTDMIRIFIVCLEALARHNAEGIADIDVLGVVFGLMRHEAGMLRGSSWAEVRSSWTTGLGSLQDQEGPCLADPSGPRCGSSSGKTILEMLDEPSHAGDDAPVSPKSAVAEISSGEEFEIERDQTFGSASTDNVNGKKDSNLKGSANDSVGDSRNRELKLSNIESVGEEQVHSSEESDEEDDETTLFVCKAAFLAIVDSFHRGGCPSKDDVVRLCDESAVLDGAEVFPVDFAVLGDGLGKVSPQSMSKFIDTVGVMEVVKCLAQWHAECAAGSEGEQAQASPSSAQAADVEEPQEKRARLD